MLCIVNLKSAYRQVERTRLSSDQNNEYFFKDVQTEDYNLGLQRGILTSRPTVQRHYLGWQKLQNEDAFHYVLCGHSYSSQE